VADQVEAAVQLQQDLADWVAVGLVAQPMEDLLVLMVQLEQVVAVELEVLLVMAAAV
jgi:hypothetical protein